MQNPSSLNRTPQATYRLQFNRQFTFPKATAIVDYLSELGISDLYASPVFAAGPESTHGYDVAAFDRLNPNLGAPEDFQTLTDGLRRRNMGLLLDMVPNHMGTHPENEWWKQALRKGPDSKYGSYFDVNWNADADRKVLLPILGDRYGAVLKAGELRLDFDGQEVYLTYFDKQLPLSPAVQQDLRRMARFKEGDPQAVHELKRTLEEVNRNPDKLHAAIQAQHYRLAYWRVGPFEINYRRFFDVTELVSVRVEDEAVFNEMHRFVFELIRRGEVTGLRIDHPDGLWDPKTYFDRLQHTFRAKQGDARLFVVVEKILAANETLPEDWNVSGTTGYDYLNFQNGLFVVPQNEAAFTEIHNDFTGSSASYEQVEYEAKNYVLKHLFPKEVCVLTARLRKMADRTVEGMDFTTPELESVIVEFIAAFPAYRTYARADRRQLPTAEAECVRHAATKAGERAPSLVNALNLLQGLLLLERIPEIDPAEQVAFVSRFQQLTGPATAKGVEDTAFYRYTRFLSLNEVGGNPGRFGVEVGSFHQHNIHKQQRWPHSLLATATHDTKRGEDHRARLNILSEMPGEWKKRVNEWRHLNAFCKYNAPDGPVPSANDEYRLYQTLVGSWSGEAELNLYINRIQEYMRKASREAKNHTSWIDPNPAYEEGTSRFIASIFESAAFRASLDRFARRVSYFGVFNSLAQVILKICSPGVPDFYQGTELWDFSLVDPDNRRSVDYEQRRKLLRRITASGLNAAALLPLLNEPASGEVKLFTIWAGLQFRNRHRPQFASGEYIPLEARGERREHMIGFARKFQDKSVAVVVSRWPFLLARGEERPPTGTVWGDTVLELPTSRYRDVLTGAEFEKNTKLSEILGVLPFALLESI